MKITKKQRKAKNGMNAITQQNFKSGFCPPRYAGMEGAIVDGKMMPAHSKIARGTPYVNPKNFDGSKR